MTYRKGPHNQRGVDPVDASQDLLGQLAAQPDIDAASGHIRGDGHGTERARTGNDLALFRMFAGVQDLMGDTGFQDHYQPLRVCLGKIKQPAQARQVRGVFGIEGEV
jgi:hypothetical protein